MTREKPRASMGTIQAFLKAVWPEYTELQTATTTEDECLREATRLITNAKDAAEAERAKVGKALDLRLNGMRLEYPQYAQVTAWAMIGRMREAIVEVCGPSPDAPVDTSAIPSLCVPEAPQVLDAPGTATNTVESHEVDADWSGDPLRDTLVALEATKALARELRDVVTEAVALRELAKTASQSQSSTYWERRDAWYKACDNMLATPAVQALGGKQ